MNNRNWGEQRNGGTRQEAAAAPERFDTEDYRVDEPGVLVVKNPPGRKNTRDWCRGKSGRQHTLVIEIPENAFRHDCQWRTWNYTDGTLYRRGYLCYHVERCSGCQKVLRHSPLYHGCEDSKRYLNMTDCPHYQDLDPQE